MVEEVNLYIPGQNVMGAIRESTRILHGPKSAALLGEGQQQRICLQEVQPTLHYGWVGLYQAMARQNHKMCAKFISVEWLTVTRAKVNTGELS